MKDSEKVYNYSKSLTIIRMIYEPVPGVGGSIRHTVDLYKHIDPYVKIQYLINPVQLDSDIDNSVDDCRILRPYKRSIILTRYLLYFADIWLFAVKSTTCIKKMIMNMNQPIIIHVHGLLLGLYMVFLKKITFSQIPIIIMVHGRYTKSDHNIGFSYKLENMLMRCIEPSAYILLNDGTDVEDLEKRIRRNTPYVVVYHAFDLSEFHKIEIGDAASTFRILFPHRLIGVKSPEIALAVVKEFISRIQHEMRIDKPDIELVFLSPEGYRDEVAKLQLEDYVVYAGFQTPKGMLYQYNKANIVIGTSLSSNMGRGIQEAMTCETPVVTFSSGHMELLIEDTVDGYLVRPGDVNGMADILFNLYKNQEGLANIGRNARAKIIRERSWEKRVQIELGVYESLQAN